MKTLNFIFSLLLFVLLSRYCFADQTIIAHKVAVAPIIDGISNDAAWSRGNAIITYDKVADIDVIIKAAYVDYFVYFLVEFPDPDESRLHKSWVWDKGMNIYKIGSDCEDSFVFKWNMESKPVDLSVYSDDNYMADIWFWKAVRTDPSGFADDKMHYLGVKEQRYSAKIVSRSGENKYLSRPADKGTSACRDLIFTEHDGDVLPHFEKRQPTGSRANVRAKGKWSDGKWTIEFARALNTGNVDDVLLRLDKEYLFGISRYEVAARDINPRFDQPLNGAGDVSEKLILKFGE